MVIKYSCFRSMLQHSNQFIEENNKFINDIEEKINSKLIESNVEDYDCDLKLLFVQTGGSEGIFLNNLNKLKPPFFLLTNGGNNSLAASLEILTYAKLHGFNGEILHGDNDYIANRIIELVTINSIKNKLANSNLGVIGTPSDWLISSIPETDKLKAKLNINLKFLPLKAIEKDISTTNLSFQEQELQKANKIYSNLNDLIKKENINGLTIRCFDLLTSIKMTGCLALAKLNQDGIVSTCEGDIMAMVSMLLVSKIFNQTSFQANPSRINTSNNEIVFAHCTIPLDMVESYSYMTHFESGIGVAIKGKLKEEDVTIFRLSSSLNEYSILQGKIIENLNESNLCRTQIKIKCEDDVSILLKNPCGNHHIIFYGHHKDELTKILNLLLK